MSALSFGPELWDVVSPGRRPKAFRSFPALDVGGRRAPATGGDLLLHTTARRADLCFELALRLRRELGGTVEVMDEVHGFRYLETRDLTGFMDGTQNPKGRVRADEALVRREDPAFAGGSHVFTQRYVHDLASWEGLAVREQEAAIGRRKRDSRELEIVRHSFPYGTTSECGLFFIAYTRDLAIPEKMLRRMMGAANDGIHDRLMEFTRAVSGATFFSPSLAGLRSLGSR